MTKLTLENQYGKYIIEIKEDDLNIDDIMDNLIIPGLLACGYSRNTINDYLGVDDGS